MQTIDTVSFEDFGGGLKDAWERLRRAGGAWSLERQKSRSHPFFRFSHNKNPCKSLLCVEYLYFVFITVSSPTVSEDFVVDFFFNFFFKFFFSEIFEVRQFPRSR